MPSGNIHLNLWLGNEIDTAARQASRSDFLVNHDALANKMYDCYLYKQKRKYEKNDPLRVLKLYSGNLLIFCQNVYKKYVGALKEIINEIQCHSRNEWLSIILMGPRAKENLYENLLVNVLIYYVNYNLRKAVDRSELNQIWNVPIINHRLF